MQTVMNLLFQEATPNTDGYMIAGYIVIFGVMLIYLFSLVIRQRSLKKDLDLLEDLESSKK